jgi:hypothetical protein
MGTSLPRLAPLAAEPLTASSINVGVVFLKNILLQFLYIQSGIAISDLSLDEKRLARARRKAAASASQSAKRKG